jgi:hypothetical protein
VGERRGGCASERRSLDRTLLVTSGPDREARRDGGEDEDQRCDCEYPDHCASFS